mgnify:CR=1 FL=1|jgi:hypothetical protein
MFSVLGNLFMLFLFYLAIGVGLLAFYDTDDVEFKKAESHPKGKYVGVFLLVMKWPKIVGRLIRK